MADRYLPVQVGGLELLVETVRTGGNEPTSRLGDVADQARDAFLRAQAAIVEIAASTVSAIQGAGERAARPDAVEVEFGLKFSGKGNVIVAEASGEATLKVKLTYSGREAEASSNDDPDAEES